jgi:hypothetical protein
MQPIASSQRAVDAIDMQPMLRMVKCSEDVLGWFARESNAKVDGIILPCPHRAVSLGMVNGLGRCEGRERSVVMQHGGLR